MQTDRNKYITILFISSVVVILDQVTKYLILKLVPLYSRIEVLAGCLDIVHIRNSGIAFGLLKQFGTQYKILSIVAVSTIAVFLLVVLLSQIKKDQKLQMFSLSLILGGAIGNIIDRFRIGEVVDFIDAYWKSYHWPAFNVADSAITVGIILMIIDEVFRKRKA